QGEAEERGAIANNKSENNTTTNRALITQILANSSAIHPAPKDTAASADQQQKGTSTGLYRNESPQRPADIKEGDPESGSEQLKSEIGAIGTPARMKTLADDTESTGAENAAEAEGQAKAEAKAKIEAPVKIELPARAETAANTEAAVSTKMTAKNENNQHESLSKQSTDLAGEMAGRDERMASERAQLSSSIEKGLEKRSESARKASQMASERSAKLEERRSEKDDIMAQKRTERNDAAMSTKALSQGSNDGPSSAPGLSSPSAQFTSEQSTPSAQTAPSAQFTSEQSTPAALEGDDAAPLTKASASFPDRAERDWRSSQSERREKIADQRADRNAAAAAAKASAAALKAQTQSERMKAKEKASEMALSAANARKSKLQESRSRSDPDQNAAIRLAF
ncbi:hypothetical protein, partial [Methanothrix sp.]|uniref:hypothetical protein n=2 Tax=Methanothrix sp. TaxID=90426 RepID=UPI003C73AFCF